ncbi:MAG: prolyl oligopeptidase family serine peptidase [Caulobacteraceae bacterium]
MKDIAPFGCWTSPIGADRLAAGAIAVSDLRVSGGDVYWVESRPAEGGRGVVMRANDGSAEAIEELTPRAFNVRTRVHEYGGAPFFAGANGLVFANFADQRLYCQSPGEPPEPVTTPGLRFADIAPGPAGGLLAVREDHRGGGEPRNAAVRLSCTPGEEGVVLFGASDFVASPRADAERRRIALVAWDHPNMPWDDTSLMVGEFGPEGLLGLRRIAGGPGVSAIEPQWGEDGRLWFISDESGWWNLHVWSEGGEARPTLRKDAEFAGPAWTLGHSDYALFGPDRVLARWSGEGAPVLALIEAASGKIREFSHSFVELSGLVRLDERRAAMIAASADDTPSVVLLDIESGAWRIVRRPSAAGLTTEEISVARAVRFPTKGGAQAHAFYYPPTNGRFEGPKGEKPPLVLQVHGGPTGHAGPGFRLATQYWTSRGFAFLDVNYGGSAGYGRAYRKRLEGQWGLVDVDDARAAAQFLVSEGLADPARLAIRGGSAGGFTVLACLTKGGVFGAGASYYGVADLGALARETHKFESRYLDGLIGPWPQAKAVYDARSPLFHLEGFSAPLIILQGADDPIVPRAQALSIRDALLAKGSPVAFLEFQGESHGFRKAETLIACAEAELSFYGQVFGFDPAGGIAKVEVNNLST